jgi:hypothetical protein
MIWRSANIIFYYSIQRPCVWQIADSEEMLAAKNVHLLAQGDVL